MTIPKIEGASLAALKHCFNREASFEVFKTTMESRRGFFRTNMALHAF
jgi:hypothetical protein